MWLCDVARAMDRSGLAGLFLSQELLMGEFCPYQVDDQMEGMNFAFAVPRLVVLLVCAHCRGPGLLQIATALPWNTVAELRMLLNPHFPLPWCLNRVITAPQVYSSRKDGPPEFLRPSSSAVASTGTEALRGPTGGVLVTFCRLPAWKPRPIDAPVPPTAYAGEREWSHASPLMAKERATFLKLFLAPDVRPA